MPASRSCKRAIAVKLLVIQAIRNTVSSSTGARVRRSRTPSPFAWTSSPSITIPKAKPGTPSRRTASARAASIAGNADASFARRAGSVNAGGGSRPSEERRAGAFTARAAARGRGPGGAPQPGRPAPSATMIAARMQRICVITCTFDATATKSIRRPAGLGCSRATGSATIQSPGSRPARLPAATLTLHRKHDP